MTHVRAPTLVLLCLWMVACRHTEPTPFTDDDGRTGFKDREGRVLVAPTYEAALDFSSGLAAVRVNGLWGFVDTSGKMVIAPRFTAGGMFGFGSALVGDGKEAATIDRSGAVVERITVTPVEGPPADGLTPVYFGGHTIRDVGLVNAHWGYVDTQQRVVVAPRFGHASAFSFGLGAVDDDGKYGLINRDGAWVTRPIYADVRPLVQGLAAVNLGGDRQVSWTPVYGGLWGFVDATGREAIAPRYTQVTDFSEGAAYVQRPGYRGFLSQSGKETAPLDAYTEVGDLHGGRARVRDHTGRWGYVGVDGKLAVPVQYVTAKDFENGGAMVCVGELLGPQNIQAMQSWKCGFIAVDGSIKLPLIHDDMIDHYQGIWIVRAGGKSGICGPDHKMRTALEFDFIGMFSNNLAQVKKDGLWGLVNLDGQAVTPLQYTGFGYISDGKLAAQQGKLWGYLDATGKQVIPPRFDTAYAFEDGRALVVLEGKEVTIDATGRVITP